MTPQPLPKAVVPDMSRCTDIQRRTFRMFFKELSPELQQQWNGLSQKGGSRIGKQKNVRSSIFAVTRNSPTTIHPSARNLSKSVFSFRRHTDAKKEHGLTATELRAKFGKDLFNAGLAEGDIVEDKDENLFYMRSHQKNSRHITGKDKQADIHYAFADNAEWMGGVASMMNKCSDWVQTSGAVGSSGSLVGDALLSKLQQSLEASQDLRINVAKCGQELMRVTTLTDEAAGMVRHGFALSKKLLEAGRFSSRSTVEDNIVIK
jgi:hypothetical protein